MLNFPNTPTLIYNSNDRVGYDENHFIEDENYYYFTFLDLDRYNHLQKIRKSNLTLVYDYKTPFKATDNHGQLTLDMDKNGKLHLIGGSHTDDNCYYYVEKNAGSGEFNYTKINSFMTYPKIKCFDDFIYLTCRASTQKSSNFDYYVLGKYSIYDTVIDLTKAEKITATGTNEIMPGYSQTSYFNDDNFYFLCNWYTPANDKSEKGFYLRKDLNKNIWYDYKNQSINLPVNFNYFNFMGDEFRNSTPFGKGESCYWFKTEILLNDNKYYMVENGKLSFIDNAIPSEYFVNGFMGKNNTMYCVATNKINKNIVVFKSKDKFKSYEEVLIGNCGKTPFWASSSINISNENKLIIRMLINYSNLKINII